jgi:hypothetical protein
MYKNPQTSDQARRLREALAQFGVELPHAKALEVVSRMAGERTLHVAQAKNNAGVRIAEVARRQAAVAMFSTLGRFEGNFEGLLAELRAIGVLAEAQECVAAEQAYQDVFLREGAPTLRARFDLRAEDIPAAFDQLAAELAGVLTEAARAPQQQPDEGLSYQGPMFDWQVYDNGMEHVPEPLRRRYEMTMKQAKSGSQFYLDIAPAYQEPDELDGLPQLGVIVEVNQGVPCVHLTNALFGDQLLSVFATEDGLYLRPETQQYISTGIPDATATPALAAVYARDTEGMRPGAMRNCATMVSSNRN